MTKVIENFAFKTQMRKDSYETRGHMDREQIFPINLARGVHIKEAQ